LDHDNPPGQQATLQLRQDDDFKPPAPYVVDVPLDTVPTGGQFNLQITLTTTALNRRQFESYAGAFLQDPTHAASVQFVEQGIEVVRAPLPPSPPEPPPAPAPLPAPDCTTGTDPAAGAIQFDAPFIDGFEQAGAPALGRGGRRGGSKSAVRRVCCSPDGPAQ